MNDCPHRGEELRLASCPGCKGAVQVKVFKCSVHGECTIAKEVNGVHVCDGGLLIDRNQQPLTVEEMTSAHQNAAQRQCGTMLSWMKPSTPTVSVLLDDGREITAANQFQRQGHNGRRCVVGMAGDKWVLLQ